MKKIIYGFLTTFLISSAVNAAEGITGTELDLASIRYNKKNNTSEIKMKVYNEEYEPCVNEMYYAVYYLKNDCMNKTFEPMIIEGYNRKNEIILVNYGTRRMEPINSGSDIEQAYNYACKIKSVPPKVKTLRIR